MLLTHTKRGRRKRRVLLDARQSSAFYTRMNSPTAQEAAESITYTTNGMVTLRQRYLYRGYLQIAAIDLQRTAQPALPSTPLQGYAVTGWYITWDPTQSPRESPQGLDVCKARARRVSGANQLGGANMLKCE